MTMGFTGSTIGFKLGPAARAQVWVRQYCESHQGNLPSLDEAVRHTGATKADVLRAVRVVELGADVPMPAEDPYDLFCRHYEWHAVGGTVKLRDLVLTTGLKPRTCARYKARFESSRPGPSNTTG